MSFPCAEFLLPRLGVCPTFISTEAKTKIKRKKEKKPAEAFFPSY